MEFEIPAALGLEFQVSKKQQLLTATTKNWTHLKVFSTVFVPEHLLLKYYGIGEIGRPIGPQWLHLENLQRIPIYE